MKKIFTVILMAFVVLSLSAQTTKNIIYDDPIYTFLDKCYSKGWIYYMPDVKPYTEKRAMQYLDEVKAFYLENPDKLTKQERDELYQYIDRLKGNKYEMFKHKGEKIQASAGFAPHAGINTDLGRIKDSNFNIGTDFMLDLNLGSKVYFGVRSDIYMDFDTWEDAPYRIYRNPLYTDFNMYTYNLDKGTKGFNHDCERSPGDKELSIRMNQCNQFSADLGLTHISVGRNALDWGPGEIASLSLSKTSKPYEYIFYDIPIGKKMYYSWMTGFLRDNDAWGATYDQNKMITSHRFEFQPAKWFMFSVYETVVYSQRFALGYLNPFSLYYISEVTGGDLDNKFGGMDFAFRFLGTKLYLSLYLDDWDFGEAFNINYYHNIGSFTAGYKVYDVAPKFDLTLEYTYLSHWMYTHKLDGENRNSYSHYGSCVGHILPPNSQMAFADVTYNQTPNLVYGLSFCFTEHGYGNINTHAHDDSVGGWDIGGRYKNWKGEYNFLDHGIDGIVKERNLDWTLHGEYRIPYYGIKFTGALTLDYTRNKNSIEGDNKWRGILALGAKWQAY